jgi:hypothetical protein
VGHCGRQIKSTVKIIQSPRARLSPTSKASQVAAAGSAGPSDLDGSATGVVFRGGLVKRAALKS